MRSLIILSLFISPFVFAKEDFDSRLEALKKKQKDTDEFQLGVNYEFRGKFPVKDGYLSELTDLKKKHYDEILKLHEEECRKTQKYCLSDQEKQSIQSQMRIDLGLMVLKDKWAKERLSRLEVTRKTEEYLRGSKTCREEGKCENIPAVPSTGEGASGAGGASGGGAGPTVVISPESGQGDRGQSDGRTEGTTSATTGGISEQVEVAPPVLAEGNGAAGGASGVGQRPAEEGQPQTGSRQGASTDAAILEASTKLNQELEVLETELKKLAAGKPITQEILSAAKAFEVAKIQKTLSTYEELCKKFPDDSKACLTSEAKKLIREEAQGYTCFYERKFQYDSAQDKSKFKVVSEVKKHVDEWNALPSPRQCKTLLEKDKQASSVSELPDDMESEDKRNYQSEKCVWVTNIPRKIVSGVSCGKSKNNACVGYVSCPRKQGGGVFTRMSTCRPSLCGNEDAVKCTQDPAYWSRRPSGEDKEFLSPEVRKVIRTSRQ